MTIAQTTPATAKTFPAPTRPGPTHFARGLAFLLKAPGLKDILLPLPFFLFLRVHIVSRLVYSYRRAEGRTRCLDDLRAQTTHRESCLGGGLGQQ
jgi:hypothetical protein